MRSTDGSNLRTFWTWQMEPKSNTSLLAKILMIFEPLPVTNLHPQNIRVRNWMRDSDFENYGKRLGTVEKTVSGERIRTSDLRVMSPIFLRLPNSSLVKEIIISAFLCYWQYHHHSSTCFSHSSPEGIGAGISTT